MPNKYGVDLDLVIQNATIDGIDLSEIALFYVDLTEKELFELKRHNLVVQETGARVVARFNSEGIALYPDKVAEVYSLGA